MQAGQGEARGPGRGAQRTRRPQAGSECQDGQDEAAADRVEVGVDPRQVAAVGAALYARAAGSRADRCEPGGEQCDCNERSLAGRGRPGRAWDYMRRPNGRAAVQSGRQSAGNGLPSAAALACAGSQKRHMRHSQLRNGTRWLYTCPPLNACQQTRRPGTLHFAPASPPQPTHHEAGEVAPTVHRRKHGTGHRRCPAGLRRRLGRQRQAALAAQEGPRVGGNRNLHSQGATRLLPPPVHCRLRHSPHGRHTGSDESARPLCQHSVQRAGGSPPRCLRWRLARLPVALQLLDSAASTITGAAADPVPGLASAPATSGGGAPQRGRSRACGNQTERSASGLQIHEGCLGMWTRHSICRRRRLRCRLPVNGGDGSSQLQNAPADCKPDINAPKLDCKATASS